MGNAWRTRILIKAMDHQQRNIILDGLGLQVVNQVLKDALSDSVRPSSLHGGLDSFKTKHAALIVASFGDAIRAQDENIAGLPGAGIWVQ